MGRLFKKSSFIPENLRQKAKTMITNLCFTIFVIGVLTFTIIAITYETEDPLFHPSSKITTFLASNSIPTLNGVVTDITSVSWVSESHGNCRINDPVDCLDPNLFHLLMRTAIEKFNHTQIDRFSKPTKGDDDSSCHMGWSFRPKEEKGPSYYKDYRSFKVVRFGNCSLSVAAIGDYHSGGNAMKKKIKGSEMERDKVIFEKVPEDSFSDKKYLMYSDSGDRCKSLDHYLWSFMCMLGEAEYLNRTLVIDLSICLSKIYTLSGLDEEGKDFRFYFDFDHLKDSSSVLDQEHFWSNWKKWQEKDGLKIHAVDDIRVSPMKLAEVKESLIIRKFGNNNYWFNVCEGESASVIQRPWHKIRKSRQLIDIASAIASRMNWDFDSVHVERGEKVKNGKIWPNLDRDTRPEAILASLEGRIEEGRDVYVATDEKDASLFDPLKAKYSTHFLDEYKDLWGLESDWYDEMKRLKKGVEFDGYMRVSVDGEVVWRGKNKFETFNDLTKDCKNGVNTCKSRR